MSRSIIFIFIGVLASITQAAEPEPWKGAAPKATFNVGGVTGAAVVNGTVGYGIIPQGAIKILDRGFVSDINNQVFIEGAFGPVFVLGTTVCMYGLNLRWDFYRDETFALFGLGGIGGVIAGASLANTVQVYPRFGAGLLWNLHDNLSLRVEVSHELMAAGVMFEL